VFSRLVSHRGEIWAGREIDGLVRTWIELRADRVTAYSELSDDLISNFWIGDNTSTTEFDFPEHRASSSHELAPREKRTTLLHKMKTT